MSDTRNPNAGPGWYEIIHPGSATTHIAYVYEDGSIYLPEGDALSRDELAFASARGLAHRLVRADELAAHDAEVAAQALREAADKIHVSLQQAHKRAGRTLDPMFSQHDQGLWDGYKNAENWLRARANRIEQGGQP